MKKRIFYLCFFSVLLSTVISAFPLIFLLPENSKYTAVILIAPIAVTCALISSGICAYVSLCRLTQTDPDEIDADDCDVELKPFWRKIIRQGALINSQMAELKRRKQEFNAITENMAEGLIVADGNGKLLILNSTAQAVFSSDSDSVFTVSENEIFLASVKNALSGKISTDTFEIGENIYRIYANPLKNDGKLTGCVILLSDITEQQRREIIRSEFTSNVSHELKTPLTSIYGISEILANGIVREEDIPRFAESIHRETGRLITLVNDIIKLSQLDENSIQEEQSKVDLKEIALSVTERLMPLAQKSNITLSVTGDCGNIIGISGIIEEMIYNLTDNGIKYNTYGGYVNINLASEKTFEKITVTDNGIGIAPQHIPRIFERFYRADKSHSKQVGGTGLGLSIVKHGAIYHGAKIDVKSSPGKGSEISLFFPKI